jgi:hypothetical protein
MNKELTPAEIVAVKLLGWEPYHSEDGRAYKLDGYAVIYVGNDPEPYVGRTPKGNWPDFTDDRLAWYWIRRVEDALDEKGLIARYLVHLCHHKFVLRATVPQRLEAAIRVIEEAGL